MTSNDNSDRRPDGTFRKGVSGNPDGRPKGTGRLLRDAITERVSDDDWDAIIDTAMSFAKAGDPIAREWLASRKEGKAPQAITVNSTEHAEFVLTWPNMPDESTTPEQLPSEDTPALPAPSESPVTFDPLAMIDQQTIEAAKRKYPGEDRS